jgi:hypothetical protein
MIFKKWMIFIPLFVGEIQIRFDVTVVLNFFNKFYGIYLIFGMCCVASINPWIGLSQQQM